MMFSRVGRSISQISRSRNALSGGNGGRSLPVLTDSSSSVCESRYATRKLADNDDKFGVVLKRYNILRSLAAKNYQRNGLSFPYPTTPRFFHSLQKKIKESSTERVEKFSTQQKPQAFRFILIMFLLVIGARQFYLETDRLWGREIDKLEQKVKWLEEAKANGWRIRKVKEKKKASQEHDFSN